MIKNMNSTQHWEIEHYQNVHFQCFFFFPLLGTKTTKCLESPPYDEKLNSVQKTPFMEKPSNITKNNYFQCFSACYVQKCQNASKVPYLGKREHISKKGVSWVFLSYLHTKGIKCINSTLFGETQYHCLFHSQISKRQNACKAFYMGKGNDVSINVSLECLWAL